VFFPLFCRDFLLSLLINRLCEFCQIYNFSVHLADKDLLFRFRGQGHSENTNGLITVTHYQVCVTWWYC